MSIRRQDLTFEVPKRPEPQTFRVEQPLDMFQLDYFRRDPAGFRRALKLSMARRLAAYIADQSQLLDMSAVTLRDPVVRIEITFNDCGSYANWLPEERREGKTEGVKQTIKALPYGFNPNEFTE